MVVFTGRELSLEEDIRLHELARSVVVKDVESPERLLDETALFLHRNVAELPQIVHEAFYIAASGRPGPVLVDIPKDVFMAQGHYTPVTSIHLPGYKVFTEGHAGQIKRAAQMIWDAERPFVYGVP